MTIGEKIKKFRTKKNLTQKQLASMTGLSEPAIRNYELGNRTPSEKHINRIAEALGVSPFAISDPSLESYLGVMHTLFELENEYDATLIYAPGSASIEFPAGSELNSRMFDWAKAFTAYKEGKLTEEEYEEWKNTYPESVIFNKK